MTRRIPLRVLAAIMAAACSSVTPPPFANRAATAPGATMLGIPARLRKGVLHADVILEIADTLFARKFLAARAETRLRHVVKAQR